MKIASGAPRLVPQILSAKAMTAANGIPVASVCYIFPSNIHAARKAVTESKKRGAGAAPDRCEWRTARIPWPAGRLFAN
jgi:hypothetical protein